MHHLSWCKVVLFARSPIIRSDHSAQKKWHGGSRRGLFRLSTPTTSRPASLLRLWRLPANSGKTYASLILSSAYDYFVRFCLILLVSGFFCCDAFFLLRSIGLFSSRQFVIDTRGFLFFLVDNRIFPGLFCNMNFCFLEMTSLSPAPEEPGPSRSYTASCC